MSTGRAGEIVAELFRSNPKGLPWETYIGAALYHKECGYYASGVRDIGERGDFATSATLTTVLGKAIAEWARVRSLEIGGRPTLIEVGAGSGEMMGQVISGLGLLSRLRWSFRIVEVAQPLREQQGKRLWWRGVKWFNTLASAVQEGDSCLIFANELIDAFAPIIVERMGAQWLEVALLVKNGEIVESLREPSERCAKAIATSSVCKAGWGEREGARVEILFGFKEWLMEVRPYLQSTRILLIDYGDEAEGLCKNHPRGTLRGYFRQQKVTGMEVARRFGKQDITCDVNFTDVANWAVEAGFEVRVTATQPSFIKEYLVGAENNRLTSETDAGGYFRVIELAV